MEEATLSQMQREADEIRCFLLQQIIEFEHKYMGCTLMVETTTEVSSSGQGRMIKLSTYVRTDLS